MIHFLVPGRAIKLHYSIFGSIQGSTWGPDWWDAFPLQGQGTAACWISLAEGSVLRRCFRIGLVQARSKASSGQMLVPRSPLLGLTAKALLLLVGVVCTVGGVPLLTIWAVSSGPATRASGSTAKVPGRQEARGRAFPAVDDALCMACTREPQLRVSR